MVKYITTVISFNFDKNAKYKRRFVLIDVFEYLIVKIALYFSQNYKSVRSKKKFFPQPPLVGTNILKNSGYNVFRPPWDLRRDLKNRLYFRGFIFLRKRVKYELDYANFNYLVFLRFLYRF